MGRKNPKKHPPKRAKCKENRPPWRGSFSLYNTENEKKKEKYFLKKILTR